MDKEAKKRGFRGFGGIVSLELSVKLPKVVVLNITMPFDSMYTPVHLIK